MDFLQLPGLGIGAIKQLGPTEIEVGPIDNYHLLMFGLRGQAILESRFGTTLVNDRFGLCLAPGEEFRGNIPADCEQLVIRIETGLYRAHAAVPNGRLNARIDLAQPSLQPWLGLVNAIIGHRETIELITKDVRIARDYSRLFINLLLAGQGWSDEASLGPAAAPAAVRRAEMFITANALEPLTLEEIATAANVPPRTLLAGFRRFRQISPMRFLRQVRLQAARATLLEGGCGTSVTAAAMDAGFGHLGRFAQLYARQFGEKPSQTLERARRGTRSTG